MPSKTKALLAIIGAAICGGGIAVFAKIGLKVIPSFTFLRFFIAALFLLPILLKEKPKITKDTLQIILTSLLLTANVTLFAFGIPHTSATVSQLLYSAVPVIVAIISFFLLKEKVTIKKSSGIGVGLIGVLVIIFLPIIQGNHLAIGTLKGNLIISAAIVCFSFYSVVSKLMHAKFSAIYITTVFALTTALVLSPMAVSEWLHQPNWPSLLTWPAILSVLYVGIFGGGIYYLLYQFAIKHSTPTIASLTMFLQPAATYFWAFILLSERLSPAIIIGGILTIGGAFLTTTAKKT